MTDANNEKTMRLLEAASALLESAPSRRLNIVVFNKALFYLDLLALRDFGHTATGSTYLALPMGPVVAKYEKRLVKALTNAGIARQVTDGMAKPVELVSPLSEYHHLTPEERKYASAIAASVGKHTSADVSEFSHENLGWRHAFENGNKLGKPAAPIDMHLALQQVCDDDPWLTEPADDALVAAAASIETDEVEVW